MRALIRIKNKYQANFRAKIDIFIESRPRIISKVARDLTDHVEKLALSGEEVDAQELSSKFTVQGRSSVVS